ncbi:lipase secretion chaperone [Acinetobacter guillouiae]|uniref:lipase secretion chaperone n=1 Tax=Acinetobacter guillouiae TaxID=106649 RepID=UPI002FD9F99B
MDDVNRHKKYALLISVVLMFFGVFWYLKPDKDFNLAPNNIVELPSNVISELPKDSTFENQPLKFHGVMPTLAPSLQGTEVNCPLQVDTKGQLILSRGIRDCFDYFLSSVGEKTEISLIADIRQYLSGLLPNTAQPYAFKLLNKYIDYLHQRESLPAVQAANSADGFRNAASSLSKLRRQIFTSHEADVFFGQEEIYDKYAIAQYEINNDKSLTTNQKATKSLELLNHQPISITENMKQIIQYNQLQELTTEIQARNGTEAELYQMRKNLVGTAAANRLRQVDVEENQWQNKIDRYLATREQISSSQLNMTQKQNAINELRNNSFNSNEERLRAQTFEKMHDHANKSN